MVTTAERVELSPAPPVTARRPMGPAALVLAAVAIGLGVAALLTTDRSLEAGDVVRLVLIVTWALAGATVSSKGRARLGLLATAGAAIAGVCSFTAESGAELPHSLAVGLLPAVGMHLIVALPDGALASAARRSTVVVGYVVGAAVGLGLWAVRPPLPLWPVVVESLIAFAIGAGIANRSYVTSRGVERQRLQWLGCAALATTEVAIVVIALRVLVGWPPEAVTVVAAASVLVPAALAAGASSRLVTRVDRLLAHVVSLAGLTGVVVAVYLLVVVGLGRSPERDERSLLVLSMVAAAVAALLYLPTRERLSQFANGLVYGERQAPDEALRTFPSRLSRAIPLDELLLQLAESLRKTVADAAEVWTGSGGTLERVASMPDRGPARVELGATEAEVMARAGVSGRAWAEVWLPALLEQRPDDGRPVRYAPMVHSGELLGMIVVERAPDSDLFDDADDTALAELARQVGLALHNVQLDSALEASLAEVQRQAEELRASRARVVAAGDAERRKIERNLHDGAQQHLVALAVKLQLAKDVVEEEPEAAAELLEELRGDVKDTLQELRDLAHGIYPPLLMDGGIAAALPAAASRAVLAVEVDTEGIGRYGPEIESAIYFCTLEALQNAGKHAADATATVRIWEEPGCLAFEVADTGPGFDPAHVVGGHGFVNMSDRLGAIGGELRVDSAPGQGARVGGTVPMDGTPPSQA